MWEIEFSQRAGNYAVDSHPYNEDVLTAIMNLTQSSHGLPNMGNVQQLEEWCVWEIARHTVVYEIDEFGHMLYIWIIKPR